MVDKEIDRTGWPPGPWDSEPDEMEWVDEKTGYACMIRRNQMGSLCGYVEVPKKHPYYGFYYSSADPRIRSLRERVTIAWYALRGRRPSQDPYDNRLDVVIDVHGGLTYAGNRTDDERWFFGFDCSHAGDFSPRSETFYNPVGEEIYKDIVYVRHECAKLARQLKERR